MLKIENIFILSFKLIFHKIDFIFHLFYIYFNNYEVSFGFSTCWRKYTAIVLPWVGAREQFLFQNPCWQKKIKWRRWPRTPFEEDEIKQWGTKINCRLVYIGSKIQSVENFSPPKFCIFLVRICAGPGSELKWFEVYYYNFQPMKGYLKLYSRYCIAYGIVLSEFGLSFVGLWYWCAKLHKQENEIQNDIRFNLEIEIWETILSRRRWKTKTRL